MSNLPTRFTDPFAAMQKAMTDSWGNFFADPFFGGRSLDQQMKRFMPSLDVHVDENEMHVSAELPGLDEKDLNITVDRGTLTIAGEKRQEKTSQGKDRSYQERSYGSFQRQIALPFEVDREKVEASFKKGVLDVRLPKSTQARQESRRITVKGG